MTTFEPLNKYYYWKRDWEKIKDEIPWTDGSVKRQVAVQHSKYCEDIYHDRCTKVKNLKGEEKDYNIINPLFKKTIFEQILIEYEGYGARFATMEPVSLYSAHLDPTPRIHMALQTDEYNMFLFPHHDEIHRVPCDNQLYYVNTTEKHSFINTSKTTQRIHFFFISDKVNDIYKWKSTWKRYK